jgi:hypothetical protein
LLGEVVHGNNLFSEEKIMFSDAVRGLIIGIFVGFFGGLMISAVIVGLVREYGGPGPLTPLIINYGQPAGIILGTLIGAVGAYRMLQNLPKEEEKG